MTQLYGLAGQGEKWHKAEQELRKQYWSFCGWLLARAGVTSTAPSTEETCRNCIRVEKSRDWKSVERVLHEIV